MKQKIKFINEDQSNFYPTLQARVDAYFEEKGISKHANAFMIFKTSFYLGGLILFYLLIMSGWFTPLGMLGLAAILGLFTAFIGLNVSHDAIHGAFSSNARVNKLVGTSFNFMGANDHMWAIMHNIVHHTYTNIPGHDEDIEPVPILRLSPDKELKKIHRWQYIYAYPFYCLASLSWVFMKDYVKFFQKEIGNYENKTHSFGEYFNLFFFKAVYYTLFLVIPLVFIPLPWYQILLGFVVMHAFGGFTLAIVFMLAHVVEGPEFPEPDDKGIIHKAWAVHQMETTANFARNNPVVNFFCGGLNFQIEHHLFPRMCHVHYKPISGIVEKTAKEFNLPYFDNPTFFGAVRSHTRLLKRLGQPA
ncbi:MAG: acyl-CoA desaturase [Bacteroidetes bacterium]|nr:acyl-CoA desaturase [Bacteroidota bacterium]